MTPDDYQNLTGSALPNLGSIALISAIIGIIVLILMLVLSFRIFLAVEAVISINKNVKKILEKLETPTFDLPPSSKQKPVQYNNEVVSHPKIDLPQKTALDTGNSISTDDEVV